MLTTRGNLEIYNFLLVSTGKNIVCGTYNWYEFRNKSYHLNLKELYNPRVNFQVKKKKKKKDLKKDFSLDMKIWNIFLCGHRLTLFDVLLVKWQL